MFIKDCSRLNDTDSKTIGWLSLASGRDVSTIYQHSIDIEDNNNQLVIELITKNLTLKIQP